jgi:hypothetical protein
MQQIKMHGHTPISCDADSPNSGAGGWPASHGGDSLGDGTRVSLLSRSSAGVGFPELVPIHHHSIQPVLLYMPGQPPALPAFNRQSLTPWCLPVCPVLNTILAAANCWVEDFVDQGSCSAIMFCLGGECLASNGLPLSLYKRIAC